MKKSFIILSTLFIMVAFFSATAPALEMGGVDIHGFVSQGYLLTTDDIQYMVPETDEGIFEFNEIGINFSGRPAGVSDNLTIGVQFLAFDFGDVGNHDVSIDWAYGDYAFRDYLGLRAGIVKMPHGLYNETRKIDMLRPSIMLPVSVYPEWLREAMTRLEGVAVYGTLFDSLTYQAQYGHVSMDADGGLAKAFGTLLQATGLSVTDIDTDDAYAAALQWDTPLEGLKLGASTTWVNVNQIDMAGVTSSSVPLPTVNLAFAPNGFYKAPINLTGVLDCEPIEARVASVEYQKDRLTFAAEYVQYDLAFTMTVRPDRDMSHLPLVIAGLALTDPAQAAALAQFNGLITTPQKTDTTWEGYYGQIAYRILDSLELGAYYSELYWDKDDRNGSEFAVQFRQPRYSAWLKDTCLSVRYDFNSNWCAKVEAHHMDGSLFTLADADDEWQMYSAKLSYLF